MPQTARPFGRRNPPADFGTTSPSACDVPAGHHAIISADTAVSDAFLKFTASLAEDHKAEENESTLRKRVVPKSGRAALLAGFVAACIHASLSLETSIALGQHLGTFALAGQTVPIVAVLLLDSLWSAARASIIDLFVVRQILGRLEITNFGAYALCGGLVALLFGVLMLAFGFGDPAELPLDCASGLAAGYVYRLFAGTKPAA
jgi:uncharacterized membrane protein